MSRTDHHRPWQIIANDRTASTRHIAYFHHSYYRCRPLPHDFENCDACGWTLPQCWFHHPHPDDRRVWWHGPERARERDRLGQLAREYNAAGQLEDGDFANYQHRHSVHLHVC